MSLQIDIKQKKPIPGLNTVEIYLNGSCYTLFADNYTVNRLVEDNVVKQVKGQRHDETGKLVEFQYENLLDSAGVKYTSQVFKIEK